VNQNLRRFVREQTTCTFVKKRSKLYKRENSKLISHRAVAKVVRKLMKENAKKQYDILKEIHKVIPFPTESPVMKKEHKGFSFGKLIDLVKRGFRV
jgi:predicted XRE-type DNA-binding protein